MRDEARPRSRSWLYALLTLTAVVLAAVGAVGWYYSIEVVASVELTARRTGTGVELTIVRTMRPGSLRGELAKEFVLAEAKTDSGAVLKQSEEGSTSKDSLFSARQEWRFVYADVEKDAKSLSVSGTLTVGDRKQPVREKAVPIR